MSSAAERRQQLELAMAERRRLEQEREAREQEELAALARQEEEEAEAKRVEEARKEAEAARVAEEAERARQVADGVRERLEEAEAWWAAQLGADGRAPSSQRAENAEAGGSRDGACWNCRSRDVECVRKG